MCKPKIKTFTLTDAITDEKITIDSNDYTIFTATSKGGMSNYSCNWEVINQYNYWININGMYDAEELFALNENDKKCKREEIWNSEIFIESRKNLVNKFIGQNQYKRHFKPSVEFVDINGTTFIVNDVSINFENNEDIPTISFSIRPE